MNDNGSGRVRDQTAVRLERECIDSGLDLGGVVHRGTEHIYPKRWSRGLGLGKVYPGRCRGLWIVHEDDASDVRRDLLEQFQSLHSDYSLSKCEAGDVAARPRQTADEAHSNRIADLREHDGNGASRLMEGS